MSWSKKESTKSDSTSRPKVEKPMSPRMFLHKSNTKAANSAIAFISAHRAWMETGEIAPITMPILKKLDAGELMPTPSLNMIRQAVLDHMLEAVTEKFEESIVQETAVEDLPPEVKEPKVFSTTKVWAARILDKNGNQVYRIDSKGEEVPVAMGFDKSQRALEWTDRRLMENDSEFRGEVTHGPSGRIEVVVRGDAAARQYKVKKGPVMHKTSTSHQKLGFGVKAHQTRVTFSGC